jgi:Holliday junction resolvase
MKAGRKGTNAEYKARRLLESLGYFVIRAAGSHGCADLVAINRHEVKVVQIKAGDHARCSPAEREQLQLLPLPDNASREIWTFKDYARSPQVTRL